MCRRALVAVLVMALIGSPAACARKSRPQPGSPATPSATAATTATSAPAPSPTPVPTRGPTTAAPAPSRTTAPPAGLPARLRGQDFEAIPTGRPVVALTFDAGSTDAGLRSILATLSANGVTATFFVTGAFAERYPASIRAIVAAGHRLGNHSFSHPYLTQKTDGQIATELAKGEAAIRASGGTSTVPLFRFPFGDRNGRTIAAANASGYACVRWTVDTLGWKGTVKGGITAQTVLDRVLAGARPGEIVLMHVGANPDDGTTLDADALPTVIARLKARGYAFVTLDALVVGG